MCDYHITGKGRVRVTTPEYHVSVTTSMREGDPYDGVYEVTPDTGEHVLGTRGKTLPDNITVHAAPSGEVRVGELSRDDSESGVVISGATEVDEGWLLDSSTTRTYEFTKRHVSFVPTEETQTAFPNGGHDFIDGVTVNPIPDRYHDSSGCDVSEPDVLAGRAFVGKSGVGTGTMPENGDTGGTIGTVGGTHAIPQGHTSGGTVSLTNVSECVPENIRTGTSILGVEGSIIVPTVTQDALSHVLSIS